MSRLVSLSVALMLFQPVNDAVATTYKCTDGRQITYANIPCEDMGLKSAGPVKTLVTVMPPAAPSPAAENGLKEAPATENNTLPTPDENANVVSSAEGNSERPLVKISPRQNHPQ